MKLYWKERRSGQQLMLSTDDESEIEVGAVRQTRRGFDALAKTNTYDPGRAQKDLGSMEEAKVFVESFHPWDLFGGDMDLEPEPEVRRLAGETPPAAADEPGRANAPAEDPPPPVNDPPQPATVGQVSPAEDPPSPADDPPQPAAVGQVSPAEDPPSPVDDPPQPAAVGQVSTAPKDEAKQPAVEEKQPRKRGWRFWKTS